jgi:bacterioferritin-associated ferredoxin
MNSTNTDREKDVICNCSGTTRKQIKALYDNGVNTLESLSGRTGACSGCGACETLLLDLLAEYGGV